MAVRKGLYTIGFCVAMALVAPAASGALVYAGITAGRSTSTGLARATNLGLMAGVSVPLVPFLYIEGQYQRIHGWNARLEGAEAVLRVPIGPDVAVLGKLGGAHVSTTGGPVNSGSGGLYGAGLSIRILDPVSVRGEYQVVRISGADYRTVQGALIYHF
ncbi:MAG: hypothetical protein ACYCOR_19065 [Acidobacteriaceae bacterium]